MKQATAAAAAPLLLLLLLLPMSPWWRCRELRLMRDVVAAGGGRGGRRRLAVRVVVKEVFNIILLFSPTPCASWVRVLGGWFSFARVVTLCVGGVGTRVTPLLLVRRRLACPQTVCRGRRLPQQHALFGEKVVGRILPPLPSSFPHFLEMF